MTTVAFDGRLLACDGRRTIDDGRECIPWHRSCKFTVLPGGLVVVPTGLTVWGRKFISWVERGRKGLYPTLEPGDNSAAMLWDGKRWLLYSCDYDMPEEAGNKWALGSGMSFAHVALYLERDALLAVRAASAFDTGTGPPFYVAELSALVKSGEAAINEHAS